MGRRRRMWKGSLYQQDAVICILQESADPSRRISTRMEDGGREEHYIYLFFPVASTAG